MSQGLLSLGIKRVAVANQKGGVGKTTSVLAIGSGLAAAGKRVLLIDGDPQANLSLFFGVKSASDEGACLGKALAAYARGEPGGLAAQVIHEVRPRLDLVPFRMRRIRAQLGAADLKAARELFAEELAALAADYDFVLIDSSPSDGELERMLVTASEAVIIPLEFQLFSIAGLEAMIDGIATCSREAGRTIRLHCLLFTKSENRVGRVEQYRAVFSNFHVPIFEICKSEYLPRCLERSKTIWEGAPASYAARDYARLIERAFLG